MIFIIKKKKTKNCLRQGNPLSTLLFNLELEAIMRDSQINRVGTTMYKSYQVVAYADVVAIIAREKRTLKEIAGKLITAAEL